MSYIRWRGRRFIAICQDDRCKIEPVHSTSFCEFVSGKRSIPQKHKRPKPNPHRCDPWKRQDRFGLSEAVLRAVGDYPTVMRWIQRDVRDDFGEASDRTIYRYVRKLVRAGELAKVDIGLNFHAYTKPKARILADLEAMRDYMLGLVEITACAKDSVTS